MSKRRMVQIGIGAVVLVLCYAVPRAAYLHFHKTSATEAVATHPPPPLFETAALAPYATAMDQQRAEAARLLQGWWSTHGTAKHDKQFTAWLRKTLPAPPNQAARTAQAHQLEALVKAHTGRGDAGAAWLQTYAGRSLWQYYEQQQAAQLPTKEQAKRAKELTKMQDLAKKVGTRLDRRLQQSEPALLDSTLDPSVHAKGNGVCPCSYPGSADAAAAASATLLGVLYPGQAAAYQHMVDELGYAQMYNGNHLPSDVDAGQLLGDMIGDYWAVTRHHATVARITTGSPA